LIRLAILAISTRTNGLGLETSTKKKEEKMEKREKRRKKGVQRSVKIARFGPCF